jgi:hypothetical protein
MQYLKNNTQNSQTSNQPINRNLLNIITFIWSRCHYWRIEHCDIRRSKVRISVWRSSLLADSLWKHWRSTLKQKKDHLDPYIFPVHHSRSFYRRWYNKYAFEWTLLNEQRISNYYWSSLMNKRAQFKVSLKRYLNIHSFYSVEEFLTLKSLLTRAEVFSTICCMDLVQCVYTLCQTFFVLLLQYSEKVFICGFVVLCLCCFYFVTAAFICMFCVFMTYSTSFCCHDKIMDP